MLSNIIGIGDKFESTLAELRCCTPALTDAMLKNFATSIVHTLRQQGFQAYLVGGCVRDLLLGREPKDYDVATNATPAQVMQIFPETYAVGAQFGVVLVPAPDGETVRMRDAPSKSHAVEVATFRCDIGYSDGRHPDEVRFSRDPREDVARRDFTINGMLLDPATDEVLDFVGGRKDLEAGIIRTIGDPERRFAEDKLRMLRAVRFAARFEYAIEPHTFAAIQKLAQQIQVVSRERVRDELTRMLTEGQARRAFLLLDESGLAASSAAGNFRDEGRGAAAGVSSRRRCVRAHAAAARQSAASVPDDAGLGRAAARCRQARRRSASLPTAFASTATWRWA